MKIAAALVLIVGSCLAIPIDHGEEWLRAKKHLKFGGSEHCSGAGPITLYLANAPQPHYREHEEINEEQARSGAAGYGGNSYSGSSGGYGASGGYSGSGAISSGLAHAGYSGNLPLSGASPSYGGGAAVGLFPNARVGGCNIPLLLSCAPNVVAGHLVESHGYAAPAYRSVDEDFMKEAEWMKQARAASHHKISEDYPESSHHTAPLDTEGSHHTVSKDYPEPNLTRIVPVHHNQNEQTGHDEKHKD